MNKIRILAGAVILLTLLNGSTIATIIYHNYREKQDSQTLVLDATDNQVLNGRFMRQTVGFNNAQMEGFRAARREFQPEANKIVFRIDSLKNKLFDELNSPQPDTVKLASLSDQIGRLHGELKKQTAGFYLKMKSICTPEQLRLLRNEFTPLFCTENANCCDNGNACGRRNRHGFGNQ